MMMRMKLMLCVALLSLGPAYAQAQTGCTAQTQAQNLTALADGQAVGAIPPLTIRNLECSHPQNPTGQIFTSGASVTMSTIVLKIKETSGAAIAVTLPVSPIPWLIYTVKVDKGDAATNPVTLTPSSGLIDDTANYVINIPQASVMLEFDGTNWSIN